MLISNVFLAKGLTLETIDIEHFFPHKNSVSIPPNALDFRYLFVHETDENKLINLQEKNILQHFIPIPNLNANQPNNYLVLYKENQQTQLISNLKASSFMGTPILGDKLSEEFLNQVKIYLIILTPILLLLIIRLTSTRYLFNLLTEISLFSLIIISYLNLSNTNLNPASLLSLIFIYIYAFTMVNQIYFNNINTKNLISSIAISLLTTWLSAFLLSFSDFGVISEFGFSLMVWLLILSLYLSLRLWLIKRITHPLNWIKIQALQLKKHQAWIFIFSMLVISLGPIFQPIEINLNPLSLSSFQSKINEFENTNTYSQPILIAIQSKKCSLLEVTCNQNLNKLEQSILKNFPIERQRVTDLDSLYQSFTENTFDEVKPSSFGQFKLAMEMLSSDQFLYSNDYKTAYMMVSVSLLTSIENLTKTKRFLLDMNQSHTDFEISVLGRFNDVAEYQSVFIQEMWLGIVLIFAVLAIGISIYYQKVVASISLLPAALTLIIFSGIHWWAEIELSIMSLIAVVLFVGLIADNIIHILIAYKTILQDCFKVTLRPIILSNIIMIASLALMAFVERGFLKIFGLELALLLTIHLLLIVFLLPSLLRIYMAR